MIISLLLHSLISVC